MGSGKIICQTYQQVLEKKHRTQHCLMYMDLSRDFDTIHYDLMIAKLRAYGDSQDIR